MNIKILLKWKLAFWLTLIGFVTSFIINLSLLLIGSHQSNARLLNYPILTWQEEFVSNKVNSINQQSKQYLQSLVDNKTYEVSYLEQFYTSLTINSFAMVDKQSNLIYQTNNMQQDLLLHTGDVGNQIPIKSRDDLADALIGHNNSGIESFSENQYLIIKSIKDTDDNGRLGDFCCGVKVGVPTGCATIRQA